MMTHLAPRPSPAAHAVPHLTADERVKLGKEARARAPDRHRLSSALRRTARTRSCSSYDRPPPGCPNWCRSATGECSSRRSPSSAEPRSIMASDLETTPRSGLTAQVCGDAHLSNFGLFASPGAQADVRRQRLRRDPAGAVGVGPQAARGQCGDRRPGPRVHDKEARTAALEVGASYRREMARLAGLSTLDVWYSHIDVAGLLAELEATAGKTGSKADKRMAARTAQAVTKARTRDSLQALSKLTTVVDGQLRIVSDPPLIVPTEELFSQEVSDTIRESFHPLVRGYRHSLQSDRRHLLEEFQFVQIARKVVGVGSVGTRAWILLMVGLGNEDPLILQAKEAEASVLEEFVGKSGYANHGARVVAGQHLMQAASDIFLGYQAVEGPDGVTRDFYLRQLRDWKGSFEVEGAIPPGLTKYVGVCAQALARAHARSGDRVAIASYLGNGPTFDRALAEFAETYADQNERDYEALRHAASTGRITVESGL